MGDRERWLTLAAAELEISQETLDAITDPILDLVRDIARGVNRPSAPLTAFMVGLAAGSSGATGDGATVAEVQARIAQINALVANWEPADEE